MSQQLVLEKTHGDGNQKEASNLHLHKNRWWIGDTRNRQQGAIQLVGTCSDWDRMWWSIKANRSLAQ